MTCEHCSSRVKKSLERIAGVKSVVVSLGEKKVEIIATAEFCIDRAKSEIVGLGFEVNS